MSTTISFATDIVLTYDGTDLKNGETVIVERPISLANTDSEPHSVYLDFTAPVNSEDVDLRFVIHSNNITIDGMNKPIIMSTTGYIGLIQNSESPETAHSSIVVQNIKLISTESLATEGGWICTKFFKNCTMNNCMSRCDNYQVGGLFGNQCINCVAHHCSSAGDIEDGGGIFGNLCESCDAYSCHTTGTIYNGGGIFGANSISCTAVNCFSTGLLADGAGGIFGPNTNNEGSGKTSSAIKCYSTGQIGLPEQSGCGGIFGKQSNYNASSSYCIAESCFSLGNIHGDDSGSNGGIFGSDANTSAMACSSTATYCFSKGHIGKGSGGIFSSGSNYAVVRDCYSIGNIYDSAGGICGSNTQYGTITNSYSRGSLYDYGAGGITGLGSAHCSISSSFSAGLLSGSGGGGLCGANTTDTTVTNCFSVANDLYGDDSVMGTITNIATGDESWDCSGAYVTVFNSEHWIYVTEHKPYLLLHSNITNCPIGYKYTYIIQDNPSVVDGENADVHLLIGSYDYENISDTLLNTQLVYGYGFATNTILISASGSVGGSGEHINIATDDFSFDCLKSFEPIWTCNSEKLY